MQASWHETLQASWESIRERSRVFNWGGFTPKQVMDRLSNGGKQAKSKNGAKGPSGNGNGPKTEPEGSGGSGKGGSGGNGGQGPSWADAGQAALLIAALMAYNSFGTAGNGSSGGRVETIDFQTFRNTVLAKDIVDKVCF